MASDAEIELQEQQELSVEDIARLETQISLLMDLCASNDSAAPIDVVGHVSRDCLALSQRLAFTLARAAAGDAHPEALADLRTLHARATSALEVAGVDPRDLGCHAAPANAAAAAKRDDFGVDGLSVRELKDRLDAAGARYDDCREKWELRERLRLAVEAAAAAGAAGGGLGGGVGAPPWLGGGARRGRSSSSSDEGFETGGGPGYECCGVDDDVCARVFLRDVEAMGGASTPAMVQSSTPGERLEAAGRVDAALAGARGAALAAAATRVGALGALGAALERAVERGETAVAVSAARAAAAVVPALAEPAALLRHAAPRAAKG